MAARSLDITAVETIRRIRGGLWRALEDRNLLGALFILPALLILALFLAYPFFLGLWLSFTDAMIGRRGAFIGIAHYASLLKDSLFWLVTFNTFLYTIVAVAFKLILGLALAIVLNREFWGKGLVRAIVLLPWIVPTALSAIAWWWIYDAQFSVVSWLLRQAGLIQQNINFLGEPWLARWSVIVANIWRGVPFFAIGLLAGLQTIPPHLYEAAQIDGATGWSQFRHITWPLLLPLTAVVTVFSVIWTFADFQLIYILTRGGPANATHLYGTLAYQRAIQGGQMGEGAAIANFIFPVLLICVIVAFRYLRRE